MRRRFGNKEKALEIDRVTEALLELGEASLHDQDNAELLSKLAFQLLEKGDRSNALNLAKQSLGIRRAGSVARVVRLLEGEECAEARLFSVRFEGEFKEEGNLRFSKQSRSRSVLEPPRAQGGGLLAHSPVSQISGEALVRPDEPGDEFFLILSGEAEVAQRVVSTLLLRIGFLVTIL
jgi:hypothetical protein